MLHLYSELEDFNNTVIRITFAPDENRTVNDVNVPIAIVNDSINEATEQVFISQLQLISSVNPGSVDLTTRLATLCRIIDDDCKWNNVIVYPLQVLCIIVYSHQNWISAARLHIHGTHV